MASSRFACQNVRGSAVSGATHHVRVPIAEVVPLGHAKLGHRRFHLGGTQLAEASVVVGRVQVRDDDLAHLAPGPGHDHDPMTVRHRLGERAAHADGLVVGVGVDRHQRVVVGRRCEVGVVHAGNRRRGRSFDAGAPNRYPACAGVGPQPIEW